MRRPSAGLVVRAPAPGCRRRTSAGGIGDGSGRRCGGVSDRLSPNFAQVVTEAVTFVAEPLNLLPANAQLGFECCDHAGQLLARLIQEAGDAGQMLGWPLPGSRHGRPGGLGLRPLELFAQCLPGAAAEPQPQLGLGEGGQGPSISDHRLDSGPNLFTREPSS